MPALWKNFTSDGKDGRDQKYFLYTGAKIITAKHLLDYDFTVFMSDVDVVWLSPNILKYIEFVAPEKQFIYQSDIGGSQTLDGANTGFYVVRPNNIESFLGINVFKNFLVLGNEGGHPSKKP